MTTIHTKLQMALRVLALGCLALGLAGAEAEGRAAEAAAAGPVRVSVSSSGEEGNGHSSAASLSADGRFVAFCSSATNLVTGDENGKYDVFVHDLLLGTTERVSISSGNREANGDSYKPSISSDGRYVAFHSAASNLVENDANLQYDVFIHDRQTGATLRASVGMNGVESNGMSAQPSISDDGRYVAFPSEATNLVIGDTNFFMDIFVYDVQTSTTELISVDSGGAQANGDSAAPSISADGMHVVFYSQANLAAADTNGFIDIYTHDRQTGQTSLVSVASDGTPANDFSYEETAISGDGRYVAFASYAGNLAAKDTNGDSDVFIHDMQTGATTRTSVNSSGEQGLSGSYKPSISGDGLLIGFESYSSNLVTGDTNNEVDGFLRDTQMDITQLVTVDPSGGMGNGPSDSLAIASNGSGVVFQSAASNLVAEDTNGVWDVFYIPLDTEPLFDLTVSLTGSGSGTVTSSPAGIACGTVCAAVFTEGIGMNLTAAADPGSFFTGWSGDATGTNNPVSFTMNTDKAIEAGFGAYDYTLTITSEHGTVTRSPDQATYHYGDVVELTAASETGYAFAFWSGGASGSANPLQVTIQGNTTITANHIQDGHILTVTSEHGTVTRSPDQAAFLDGTIVQITAAADPGWTFDHWSGDAAGTSNAVDVTINGDMSVTANYTQDEYALTITSEHGTVMRFPDQATYHYGDAVRLTALPETGFVFDSWGGDISSTSNPLDVTMQRNTGLTAFFDMIYPGKYVAPGGNDSDTCSSPTHPCATINAAIGKASSGDTVYVAVGTYVDDSPNGVIIIDKDLVISGGWEARFTSQTGMSVIDGEGARRGVKVDNPAAVTATLEKLTIQNGYNGVDGGGIYDYNGTINFNDCLIRNNRSDWSGGGIGNRGTITVNRSIIRDNDAEGRGDDINNMGSMIINNSALIGHHTPPYDIPTAIKNSGGLVLNNSTISGYMGYYFVIRNEFTGTLDLNSSTVANNEGTGIINQSTSTSHLRNTIVANNSLDCYNSTSDPALVLSLGYNLIGTNSGCLLGNTDLVNVDPLLGWLQDNGGRTITQALLPGSPAINAGNPAGCLGGEGLLGTDQRGYSRADRCDIGAYEMKSLDASFLKVNPDYALPGSVVTYTLTLKNGTSSGADAVSITDALPDSLTYQEGSLTATSGSADQTAGVITWNGSVNSGGQVVITYGATVGQSAKGTIVINQAVIEAGGDVFTRSAKVHVPPPYRTYLPLVAKPTPGLYGHVTLNGAPAAGVNVDVCATNGANVYCTIYATTDVDGYYMLTNFQMFGAGYVYYVRFRNPNLSADGRLVEWNTPTVNYNGDRVVEMESFDIGEVRLIYPTMYKVAYLPTTFQWIKRAISPNESYQVELFPDSLSEGYKTPLLGYVDSYTMESMPPGYSTGQYYYWRIWLNSPHGGYGKSFYFYGISFAFPPNQPAALIPR
jgi:uncharacterized repeat protein (TIGR01451 family)/uncharacterized repeat protein (TIGR02543 family)